MSESRVEIRLLAAADEPDWRRLWQAYLEFYESTLPQATTDATWSRMIGDDPAFGGIVAHLDGVILGFANYVVHPFTWSELPACLLHDLFVAPEARERGAGRLMIDHLIEKAKSDDWARVYWLTKENNATARTLYDRFGPADGFIRYTVKVQ